MGMLIAIMFLVIVWGWVLYKIIIDEQMSLSVKILFGLGMMLISVPTMIVWVMYIIFRKEVPESCDSEESTY